MEKVGRFRFETIDHTADIAIVAHGDTYQEMLECAAAAMFAQQVDITTVPKEKSWGISVSADSAEDLLVAWLRELVYLSENGEVIFCDFKIEEFSEWQITGKVWGSGYSDKVKRTGAAVKAVTYHNLNVTHDDDWRGMVTFDV